MLIVSLLIGLVSYQITMRQYRKSAEERLENTSIQLMQQFDERVKPMTSICSFILSDGRILDSLQLLTRKDEKRYTEEQIKEAREIVSAKLNDAYITAEFYRVIIFNKYGDVIFSSNYTARRIDGNKDISDVTWLSEVEDKRGKNILLEAHRDDWGLRENPIVFSIGKEILGMSMGFMEVQIEEKELNSISDTVNPDTEFVIVNKDGGIIHNPSNISVERVAKLMQMDNGISVFEKENEVVAKHTSSQTQAITFVIDDLNSRKKIAMEEFMLPVGLATGFFLVSIFYVIWTSGRLVKPIRKLQVLMEETDIDNLDAEIETGVGSNNEMEKLYLAYQHTRKRLNESLIKEQKMSLLHLRAQFDTLQAQVNPHFLYNVLNVISSRGLTLEDEVICEICSSLSGILRYSTSMKSRYETVEQEMKNLLQYNYLLKVRYEHKIDFDIRVDESICKAIIPKMTLQQIVENSIEHGFANTKGQMKISVQGWSTENGWRIKISDNGGGINDRTLALLVEKMQVVREKIMNRRENVELEIGGMGLVNTYARLWLLYHDSVVFHIESGKDGHGTSVTIGGKNEVSEDVQSDYRR